MYLELSLKLVVLSLKHEDEKRRPRTSKPLETAIVGRAVISGGRLYSRRAAVEDSVPGPPFNYYRRNSGALVKYLFQFPSGDVAAATAIARPLVTRVNAK